MSVTVAAFADGVADEVGDTKYAHTSAGDVNRLYNTYFLNGGLRLIALPGGAEPACS